MVLCIDYGPEVLQLGHRFAPHLRTMEEARAPAGVLVVTNQGGGGADQACDHVAGPGRGSTLHGWQGWGVPRGSGPAR